MRKLFVKYLIEFLVIVIGISLSFYVDSYNEKKYKENLKNQSLYRILQNIKFDIKDNLFNLNIHTGSLKSANWLLRNKNNLAKFSRDSIGYHLSKAIDEITYLVDNQEEYRTLQYSGYIEFIENEELVKNLQEKYTGHNFMKTIEEQIILRTHKLQDFQFENSEITSDSIKGVYSFERRYTGQLNIPYGIIDRIAEKGSFHRYYIGQTNERLKKDSLIIQQIEKEIY